MNLYFTGSEEKALTEAIGLSILNPNSAEVLNLIASATFKRGRITDCLKFYDRALKIQPNLAEAHNNMGFVSSSLNEFSIGFSQKGFFVFISKRYDARSQSEPSIGCTSLFWISLSKVLWNSF